MVRTLALTLATGAAAQDASRASDTPTWEPAPAALAQKAPGHPPYGMVMTTPTGKFLLTGLTFNPRTHKPEAHLYRINGPAGWGPYRSGLERGLSHSPARPRPSDNALHNTWYEDYFLFTTPAKGTAAAEAGLEQSKYDLTRIYGVDGSTFKWDVNALVYHITQSPRIEVKAIKLPIFFGPSRATYTIRNHRIDRPVADDDADLVNAPPAESLRAWLGRPQPWSDLLKLRSAKALFAPLPFDLADQKRWAVLIPGQPGQENQPRVPGALEIWTEDPQSGAFERGLAAVYTEPAEGFRPGRALLIGDTWQRLQAVTRDPATGRLIQLSLQPWVANIPALLDGAAGARELGSSPTPQLQESLEQRCNDALIEWKTRTLPRLLASQDLAPTEELVIRIEKGVLALDLGAKGIRSRLDAQTRVEAERKAQAELAAKEGKTPPQAAPSATESERLADLLDQRKAILMAILGSAKLALANLRR